MEHFDIEDAFRRTTAPEIAVVSEFERVLISGTGSEAASAKIRIRLAISNVGLVSAKMVVLQILSREGIEIEVGDAYRQGPNEITKFSGHLSIVGPADFIVHPGQTRFFVNLSYKIDRTDWGDTTIQNVPAARAFLRIEYALGAENMRMAHGVLEFNRSDLLGNPSFLDRG